MDLVPEIQTCINAATDLLALATTAARNNKSLQGHGNYASRFHDCVVTLSIAEKKLMQFLSGRAVTCCDQIENKLLVIKNPVSTLQTRKDAFRELDFIFKTIVGPHIAQHDEPTKPNEELVISLALFKNAPAYLQRVAAQANGCFNERWFDASAVMIRRIVESLIIEVYEKNGRSTEIQSGDQYLMLADLVKKIGSQTYWALNRETQKTLPLLKSVGDRSAHARYYGTQRNDIERILVGLRVTVDNLLQHAGYAP